MYKLDQNILPNNGEAYILSLPTSDLYQTIIQKASWRDDKIKIFGKVHDQPRKVAWCADKSVFYKYSGIVLGPAPWIDEVAQLRRQIESITNLKFNSALINYYRDGVDYMGWHSDDEKELGKNPAIASYSLGESRDFLFRMKSNHGKKIKLSLENADLLIMKGETQHYWQHALPKRLKIKQGRINITFRYILT